MHCSFAVASVLSAFPFALGGEEGQPGSERGEGPLCYCGGGRQGWGQQAEVTAHVARGGAEDALVTDVDLRPGERSGWSCGVIAEPSAANIPLLSTFLQELLGEVFSAKWPR